MRFYAVVSLETGRTVETFRAVGEAEAMVAECKRTTRSWPNCSGSRRSTSRVGPTDQRLSRSFEATPVEQARERVGRLAATPTTESRESGEHSLALVELHVASFQHVPGVPTKRRPAELLRRLVADEQAQLQRVRQSDRFQFRRGRHG